QVVAAMVWRWLLNADYGPVAVALLDLGLPRIDPLSDPHLAMLVLVLANVWRSVAFPMVLFLAALQGIPENLYRAARVDGIPAWMTFRRVTLPMLRPTLLVCVVILTLSDFNIVALPLVLTGGGPLDATDLVSLRLYREAFADYHIGTASALAILLFLVNIVLTIVYLRALRART
ncbi:MAG TPA: sugar ABC transporter permease, partial [Burkholderiales bacterium]|nr:sugar ABC transporter permease [Burkholderiales bacterium]